MASFAMPPSAPLYPIVAIINYPLSNTESGSASANLAALPPIGFDIPIELLPILDGVLLNDDGDDIPIEPP
jgi:hypothetical protein